MPRLFVSNRINTIIIDTAFGRGPDKRLSLDLVGDVLAEAAARYGFIEGNCSLHLPAGVSLPPLPEDEIDNRVNVDGSLRPGLLLAKLGLVGQDDTMPLIIEMTPSPKVFSVWKCSVAVVGAATTLGVRQNVYNFAFENNGYYEMSLGRQSIRYNEEKCLLADILFETKDRALTFETSLRKFSDGFNHQLDAPSPLFVASFEMVECVLASGVKLERVYNTDYNPAACETSPQTSLSQLYEHSITSIVDITTPLFTFQRIENETLFSHLIYRPDKCHLLDKAACVGTFSSYKTNENNIILLSKDFHSLFDGLNGEVPGILLAFRSGTKDCNIATGRYEVELYVEFYDTAVSRLYSSRLKPDSQKHSELVWMTKLWVMDVNKFKFCLDWKTERTADLWRDKGRSTLNYLNI